MPFQDRFEHAYPFGITQFVRVQKIGKFLLPCIFIAVGKDFPGFGQAEAGIFRSDPSIKLIECFDPGWRTIVFRATGKYFAQHNGQTGVQSAEGIHDPVEIACDHSGFGVLLQIVGACQNDHAFGMKRQNVIPKPVKHAPRGVSADAAISQFYPGKIVFEVIPQSAGDRVAKEDKGVLIVFLPGKEELPPFLPYGKKPVRPANGSFSGHAAVVGRKLDGGDDL